MNDNEQTGATDPSIPSAPELFVLLITSDNLQPCKFYNLVLHTCDVHDRLPCFLKFTTVNNKLQ
jgi:hypothetical protein